MAKLDGVKVIDAKDGEITKIEYEGTEYVFTDTEEEKDDIALIVTAWGSQKEGEYYHVIRNEHPLYLGDSDEYVHIQGKWRFARSRRDDVRLFRKSTTPSVKVGDKVRITNAFRTYGLYGNGDILTVKSIEEEAGVVYVTVEENSGIIYPKEFEIIDGDDLDNIRWEQIGRKLYEFRKGDIARVVESPFAHPVDTLVEVESVDGGGDALRAKAIHDSEDGMNTFFYSVTDLELVAPVEQRFDIDTKGRR